MTFFSRPRSEHSLGGATGTKPVRAGIKNQSLNHLTIPHLMIKPLIRIGSLMLTLNYFALGVI